MLGHLYRVHCLARFGSVASCQGRDPFYSNKRSVCHSELSGRSIRLELINPLDQVQRKGLGIMLRQRENDSIQLLF